MSSENVIDVTDQNFDEVVLKSNIAVVVDFWAPWCGPCRAFGSQFELIAKIVAEETEEQMPGARVIKFVKLNIDENPAQADRFSVHSIPTIALFRDGMLVEKVLGAMEGLDLIDRLLASFS